MVINTAAKPPHYPLAKVNLRANSTSITQKWSKSHHPLKWSQLNGPGFTTYQLDVSKTFLIVWETENISQNV